ncbi:MAG: response regulator transcription factor [Actinomycetes bacterium]
MIDSGKKCILIVEDHLEIVRTLVMNFRARGYLTLAASDAKSAFALLSEAKPDAVILDLGLPDMDGLDVITQTRSWSSIPILVLSGRTELDKKLSALKSGADDYISKPFDIDELVARVEAVFRRTQKSVASPQFLLGAWKVDLSKHTITDIKKNLPDLHLTPIEWRLLEYLLQRAGSLVSQRELLQNVWGASYEIETNYLRLFISQLRKKIEPVPQLPKYLLTEPGVGYRIIAKQVETN